MAKKLSKLEQVNRKLSLENSLLKEKASMLGRQRENSLSQLAQGLTGGGGDFGGGANPMTSFNPILQANQYAPVTLMWTMLMYMYKTHGLIQTAIDMPVLDALRGGLEFSSDGQLDADDIARLEDYLEENSVLERVGDAFIWARTFGGGALIINTEGDHEEPIGDEVMDGRIEFYDACRWELTCERRIPARGKYGFYGKNLDKSRVITILGKRAPWLIRAQLSDWGMSEIERMMEDFNLYIRNRSVIYELLEEAKVDVYQLEGFTAQLASSTGTALTQRRIQVMNQIKNFNNALVMDKKDGYEMKQMGFGGLAEMMKENRMGIASALRMPMTKLFGMGSTGFSSGEEDIENYNGLIESEVRQPMKAVMRKVLKIVVRHLFHDDLDIGFKFKPLRILSATDEENVKTSKANRYTALYDRMLMSSKEVGEALQKDNLVPIPLQAEKGLLDDHPTAAAETLGMQPSVAPGEDPNQLSEAHDEPPSADAAPIPPLADKAAAPAPAKIPEVSPKPVKAEKAEKEAEPTKVKTNVRARTT